MSGLEKYRRIKQAKKEETGDGTFLMVGDCLQRLKEIPDNSLDSCVCDPPYAINFMGVEL